MTDFYGGSDSSPKVVQDVVAYANFNSSNGVSIGIFALTANTTLNVYTACLLASTEVSLADGTTKPVEDITYDDELLVWDFDNARLSKSKPIWIKKASPSNYWFLNKYKSGKVLKTTGKSSTGWGHRTFDLDKKKFVYTTESVSDSIYTLDGPDMHMSC